MHRTSDDMVTSGADNVRGCVLFRNIRTQVQSICQLSNEKNINDEFKAGSLHSLLRITKANHGVATLPYLASLELTDEERDKIVPFAYPVPVRSVRLVTHKHFVKKKLLDQMQK